MTAVANNRFALTALEFNRLSSTALSSTMQKISSGERLNRPGDAPADYGIAETYSFQIRNSQVAQRNMQNAQGLIDTADSWLQQVQDMLGRMSELAVSAVDGSKSKGDRGSLNEEFLQLKTEISRIATSARYNRMQIASKDQVLTYDNDLKTFRFSQLDGTEGFALPTKVMDGLLSSNGLDFAFDATKDYTLSADGRYIFYVDKNDDMVRYSVEDRSIMRDTSSTGEAKQFKLDDVGRLWYASENAATPGEYDLHLQDIALWTEDTSSYSNAITGMGSPDVSIYQDRAYFLEASSGNIVQQSLYDANDQQISLDSTDTPFNTSNFAISSDGFYLTDIPAATPNIVRVVNIVSKEETIFDVGPNALVTDLRFSFDGNMLGFIDANNGAVHTLNLERGEKPLLSDLNLVESPSGAAGLSGLSLEGGAYRSLFQVHNGPNPLQSIYVETGDVRWVTLGISQNNLSSIEQAKASIEQTAKAIDILSQQRGEMGAQYQHLAQSYQALVSYTDSISGAESVLRDANIAEETAVMAQQRLTYDITIAMITQANNIPRGLTRLLQATS